MKFIVPWESKRGWSLENVKILKSLEEHFDHSGKKKLNWKRDFRCMQFWRLIHQIATIGLNKFFNMQSV